MNTCQADLWLSVVNTFAVAPGLIVAGGDTVCDPCDDDNTPTVADVLAAPPVESPGLVKALRRWLDAESPARMEYACRWVEPEPEPEPTDPRHWGGVACGVCNDTGVDFMFDGSTRLCACRGRL